MSGTYDSLGCRGRELCEQGQRGPINYKFFPNFLPRRWSKFSSLQPRYIRFRSKFKLGAYSIFEGNTGTQMNGLMDPELIKAAQEQMSRIPPAELMKLQQQMMANPELMQLATESMKNLKPEDVRFAAEQLKHVRTEDMVEISERMSRASPQDIAAMRVQSSYQLQGAQNLKNQGNQLHALGKFIEAANKYLQAKNNVMGIALPEAKNLQIACSLNLMSCYLKTKQYEDCVQEGSEVLAQDVTNVKALYRRGQAYKESGKLELAVADLSKALEVSPDDETIAQVLREAREALMQGQQNGHNTDGLLIEEITEEEPAHLIPKLERNVPEAVPVESSVTELHNVAEQASQNQRGHSTGGSQVYGIPDEQTYHENFKTLSQNPDMIRNLHSLMTNVDPDSLAALSGGKMTSDMVKVVSDMAKKMSPSELQKMIELTSALERHNQAPESALENMRNQSSITGSRSIGSVTESSGPSEENVDRLGGPSTNSSLGTAFSSMPNSSSEMQEQMRKQMKDPAMRQMFTTMIKNMNPEMMANMSEQFGIKLSPEEAAKAQHAMSSLNPDDLDRLMMWAERFHRISDHAQKFKNWLLGKPGLILAFLMLLFAIILHWLGYIGD